MIACKTKNEKLNLKARKIFYPLFLCTLLLISSCGQKEKKEEPTFNIKTESKTTPVAETSSDKTQDTNILGKRMFIACAACHNLKKGEAHKVGPNLYGIFNKKAATTEGFEYSEALKNSGITWSEETIRKWMQDPAGYVPQTKMAFVGIKKEEQQTALIEYLKEETKIEE
ncbi:c-type cytochrome [uncultured Maribacter sp.]|uniref:c-type cytochrome n=1 Tax=uncultured Maribacter sp. TaxID=431308 RepID=UPI002615D62A|nr:c-type cytochrome [uncultured Maribacter sp.]